MLTFKQLQTENAEWQARNFPNAEPYYPLLGAIEELGELSHSHLKLLQGIRGTEEQHIVGKIDAVADVVIYLAAYCTLNNIDFQKAVEYTWALVKERDWVANKLNGSPVQKRD